MGHINQTQYNRKWKKNNPEVFSELRRRRFVWLQVSKQFLRIGIYDEFPETHGVKYY